MHILKISALSVSLAMGGGAGFAQSNQPGDAPAILTLEQRDEIIAACAAGSCGEAVQEFLAASGLTGAALDELIANLAGALVQAAANNPALSAQIAAGLQVASQSASGDLSRILAQVVAAVASGNAAAVDMTAVAQAFTVRVTPIPENQLAPTRGFNSSPS